MVAARLAALAAVAVVAQTDPARSAGPDPCRATARIEPEQAVVGQQVLYRVRIESREDVDEVAWVAPPAFAGMRVEALPGSPSLPSVTRDGARFRVREERRALFAERPGEYALRADGFRCTVRDGEREISSIAPIPVLAMRVRPPPAPTRPPDFAGVVGPLVLRASAEPARVALGESVRLSVEIAGAANLWDAADPHPRDDAFDGADVFRQHAAPVVERGERLFVRRRFVYDLVPRRAGVLRIPVTRVVYFDPGAGAYRSATAAGLSIPVSPSRDQPATPDRAAAPRAPEPAPAATGGWRSGAGWALAVLAAATLAVALGLRSLRARRGARAVEEALDAARRAGEVGNRDGEAVALATALRAALTRRLGEARASAPESLAAEPELPPEIASAARLLAAIERSRFDPASPAPARGEVTTAIAAL